MPSPDGRPVFIPQVPWHEEKKPSSDDPVWVDASGQYVNEWGEPLSQEDFDTRPKGV